MSSTKVNDKIDLGCGPDKVEGTYGVDHYPYEGVDQVFDLDEREWPLVPNSFNHIYSRHVIEHIIDVKVFMNEIHRIGRNGAIVEIETPHFSSIHSWQDPTHRWHLSSRWYVPFTEQYLAEQVSEFEHVSTEVTFSRGSIRSIIPKLIIKFFGMASWEKHYAFVFRARNIKTQLMVCK